MCWFELIPGQGSNECDTRMQAEIRVTVATNTKYGSITFDYRTTRAYQALHTQALPYWSLSLNHHHPHYLITNYSTPYFLEVSILTLEPPFIIETGHTTCVAFLQRRSS